MGRRRQSHAFRKGVILGGLAGAAALIWTAPQPGARTRELIQETIESAIFKLLDAPAMLNGPRGGEDIAVATAPPPPPLVGADIVIDGPRPSELAH
jgi:hypothetical protein